MSIEVRQLTLKTSVDSRQSSQQDTGQDWSVQHKPTLSKTQTQALCVRKFNKMQGELRER